MKTLGARLRAAEAEQRAQLVGQSQGVVEPFVATTAELKAVEALWRNTRRRTTAIVRTGVRPTFTFILGCLPYGVRPETGGMSLWRQWPAPVSRSTCRKAWPTNGTSFTPEWRAFCGWALSDELHPELVLDFDERLVQAKLLLRIRPLPAV
jgi:hypothetical protein